MPIATMLCIAGDAAKETAALKTAMALAGEHDAALRCLHISPDPAFYMNAAEGAFSAGMLVESV